MFSFFHVFSGCWWLQDLGQCRKALGSTAEGSYVPGSLEGADGEGGSPMADAKAWGENSGDWMPTNRFCVFFWGARSSSHRCWVRACNVGVLSVPLGNQSKASRMDLLRIESALFMWKLDFAFCTQLPSATLCFSPWSAGERATK